MCYYIYTATFWIFTTVDAIDIARATLKILLMWFWQVRTLMTLMILMTLMTLTALHVSHKSKNFALDLIFLNRTKSFPWVSNQLLSRAIECVAQQITTPEVPSRTNPSTCGRPSRVVVKVPHHPPGASVGLQFAKITIRQNYNLPKLQLPKL